MGLFNKKPKIVTCNDCKCLIEKYYAQEVTQSSIFLKEIQKIYYCLKCKKPYTKVFIHVFGDMYFKEIQVDENGEPIGYTKVPDGVVVTSKNVQEVTSKLKKH